MPAPYREDACNIRTLAILAAFIALSSLPTFADLLKCPDCGNAVSTRAEKCPQCGCPASALSVISTNRPLPTQQSNVMFNVVRKGLVIVHTKQSNGTGFIVRMNGKRYVLTNAHVLHNAAGMTFQTLSGEELPWMSIELADKYDVARILLPESLSNVEPLPIAATPITMNEPVLVYGNSEGRGVATELRGKVLGVGPNSIETDAEFVRGNSGSPIINVAGEVIAIATYVTRTAPGTDWVADNTRFTSTRRFGTRLTDMNWTVVEPPDLQKQVSTLADVDRLIRDVFSIIPVWLPGVQRTYREAGADALHMYSTEREVSNYSNPEWPHLIEQFCQAYIDAASKTEESWKKTLPKGMAPKSFAYQNAERQHTSSVKTLAAERDRLLASLYEAPAKTLADTQWVNGYFKEEALARTDVLDFLKQCIATVKESSDWGRLVPPNHSGIRRSPSSKPN